MIETFEIVAKAAADPNRVRILKLLEAGELCVCQVTAVLDLAPATISKHLSALKTAGMVQQRRDGKWVYYRLADKALNACAPAFLSLLGGMLNDDSTIADDSAMLTRIRRVPLTDLCSQGRDALNHIDPDQSSCCGTPT